MPKSSVHRLAEEFAGAPPEEQRLFLMRLPQILDLAPTDLALLRTSESAFGFWDNSDDAVYDTL